MVAHGADVREQLDAAGQLLADAQWAKAFDALLDAWRTLRAPEIADLCEALSKRAAKGKPIVAKTQTERVMVWTRMFHERSELGLGVLIADLETTWTDDVQPRFVMPRLEALATVHDDPRIARLFLRSIARVGYVASWNKALSRIARGLEAAADPSVLGPIRDIVTGKADASVARHAPWAARALPHLEKLFRNAPAPTLPDDLHDVVHALGARIAAIGSDVVIDVPVRAKPEGADPAALLEQVRASPDDDDLRLVLADALDAIGDPRGELIVLQIRRASGGTNRQRAARERALLKEHMREWLGAIAPVVKLKTAVFERGFLSRCEAVATRQVDAQVHFQHPEWATVRSIRFEDEARITPAMRSLREALNIDAHALKQLTEAGHPTLERLGLGARALRSSQTSLLAACPAEKLPKLSHIEINTYISRSSELDWIWDATWSKQIRSLGVTGQQYEDFITFFLSRAQLEEITFDSPGFDCTLRKVDNGYAAKVLLNPDLSGYGIQLFTELSRYLRKLEGLREMIVETTGPLSYGVQQPLRNAFTLLDGIPGLVLPGLS